MEMSGELLQLIKDTSKDIRVGQRMSYITQRKALNGTLILNLI